MRSNANNRVNRYGPLAAEVYDLDKPYGALPDTRFYIERLAALDGPVLEPACGSGRTLVPLLDAGHDVTGFDASPDMLQRCQARCDEAGRKASLSQQLLEDFRYPAPFAAILIPVGTFTLLDDFDVALSVLRRFRDHLRPGGLLMFDVPSLAALSRQADDRRSWEAANGDLLTLQGQRVRTDWASQRLQSRCRYERWRDHALVESQLEVMHQRAWGLQEMRMALAASGFGEVKVFGGYDRNRDPRDADRSFTFEALRA